MSMTYIFLNLFVGSHIYPLLIKSTGHKRMDVRQLLQLLGWGILANWLLLNQSCLLEDTWGNDKGAVPKAVLD